MKPIIYYTLLGRYSRLRILGVTSESRHNRIDGRFVDRDEPTHVIRRDTLGKFDTFEAAQEKINKVQTIRDNWCPLINNAIRKLAETRADEQAEIDKELNAP